jgi:amidase
MGRAALDLRRGAFGLGLLLCAGVQWDAAAEDAKQDCVSTIRAVLAEIAARDLSTAKGPPLNAFLTLNEKAVADAQARDAAVAAGQKRGPLHCVPVAVKDNFDTADMPVTVGSLALKDYRPGRDADLVARLRRAGAIVIGKTNMDEFAMGVRGLSGAGGRVGNAYDTRMSAGGSSSGSAAAVAAGFVPLALGSDNCGSLRLPAVYNGAVSLRPTFGRFSTDGVFPIGFINGVTGLIAKDTPTLQTGLAVMDDNWSDRDARAPDALKGRRIGILRILNGKNLWAQADSAMQDRMRQAIAAMQRDGAIIVDNVALNGFNDRMGIEFLKGFGRKVSARFFGADGPVRSWREICRSGLIRPEWSVNECVNAAASAPFREGRAARRIASNRDLLVSLMDAKSLDALIYPTDGRGGARIDVSDALTCYLSGSSGLPAAAAPAGLDGRGMPFGIEWIGRPGSDESLVAMMAAFEAARGKLPPAPLPERDEALAAIPLADQNALRLQIGATAFRSRDGTALGDLTPDRFRTLTREMAGKVPAR